MKAVWNDVVLAESDDTVIVEGNHYFPADAVNKEFFASSNTKTMCPWKGQASYYTIEVDGQINRDAAWFYPSPKSAAKTVEGRIAFWRGVRVME